MSLQRPIAGANQPFAEIQGQLTQLEISKPYPEFAIPFPESDPSDRVELDNLYSGLRYF